jgi:catechol 2,3-dioxygenase-like lactoylglutathione lyase family enzyme
MDSKLERRVSAVEFAGSARVHMALVVSELERSIAFYRALFGAEPTKRRPGYARFEPGEPSVNLSLNEGRVRPHEGAGQHYGIQVQSTAAVEEAAARLACAGYATRFERDEGCCYAVQDKVWVDDPDGNPWEIFCTLHDDHERRGSSSTSCCEPAATAATGEAGACCSGS